MRPGDRRQSGLVALQSYYSRTMNQIVVANARIELGEHLERRGLDHSTIDLLSGKSTNGGERFPHRQYHELDSTRLVFPEQQRTAISLDCFQTGNTRSIAWSA